MEEPTHSSGSEAELLQESTGECNTQTSQATTKKSKPSKKRKHENTEQTPKQLSWVWDHFTRDLTRSKDDPKAICSHCGSLIGCHPVHHGTGGMNNHLRRCRDYPPNKDLQQKILSFDKRGEGQSSNKLVVWSFNKVESRDKLARMIVLDELAFSFVEGEGFRDFCYSLCPSFEPVSRRTICRDVLKLNEIEKTRLKDVFAKRLHSVCLTTDTWTSIQNINYMVLTAHFIDDDWNLHKRIINFCVITNHEGESIGKLILKCISEWGIKRVLTITVDNTSANDVAINYVKKQLQASDGCVLDGIHMHVRCCACFVNLIANDSLKDIHNSVDSIRSAVRYVRSSPARLNKFKGFVRGLNILDKTALALDIPTRWNSTYLMLEAALKYKKAFELMEEEDDHYVSYFNSGTPKAIDWANAKVFVRCLKTFYEVTLKFSCTLSVTSNVFFPELSNIEEDLNEFIKSEDVLLSDTASSMKVKYDKYWGNMSNMNNILLISCVLDPRFKMQFISICFEEMYGGEGSIGLEIAVKEVKDLLMQLYDWYSVRKNQSTTNEPIYNANSQQHEASRSRIWGRTMDKHLKKIQVQNTCSNEVDKYLNEVVEVFNHGFDVQDWWKANSVRYKVLSDIARDVFAIPVSTLASESAFSTGDRILDPFRSCLAPKLVEVLVTTQSWIKSRPIHVDHRIEMSLEDVDFYDEVIDDMMGLTLTVEA